MVSAAVGVVLVVAEPSAPSPTMSRGKYLVAAEESAVRAGALEQREAQ